MQVERFAKRQNADSIGVRRRAQGDKAGSEVRGCRRGRGAVGASWGAAKWERTAYCLTCFALNKKYANFLHVFAYIFGTSVL